MSVFDKYPIGTTVIHNGFSIPVICRVAAHRISTYVGIDKPWYGLILEPICPKEVFCYDQKPITGGSAIGSGVVIGEIPEKFRIAVLDGACSENDVVTLDEVKAMRMPANRCNTDWMLYYWPGYWMMVGEDMGDRSVGIPGGIVATSNWSAYAAEGFPELVHAVYNENAGDNGEDELDPGDEQLLEMASWLRNYFNNKERRA